MRCRRSLSLSFLIVSVALLGCDSGSPASNVTAQKPKPAAPGEPDADAPEEFTTTESGLQYRIRRKSDGKKPTPENHVTVNYRGSLEDGTIFDTTYGTGGAPSTFELKSLIPGWSEGLQLIGQGGMIELKIPYMLGYGETGSPPVIPPKAELHFIVELVRVLDPPKVDPELAPPSMGLPALEPGIVDPDAPEEFTTTQSGLKYRIRRKSNGTKPTKANAVKVHYRGWLADGTTFDSSYARNEPTDFGVGDVIPGWTEGLQLIGVGGMIELEIPGNLAYGPRGNPPKIPPNATLHFLVELIEVK